MNDLQTIGLVYDLVGILVLGLPLVAKGMNTIINQSKTYWDINKPETERMLAERLDVGLGTLVLVLGFSLQIAAVQWFPKVPTVLGWTLIGALPGCLVAYYWFGRRIVLARQKGRINARIREKLEPDDEPPEDA